MAKIDVTTKANATDNGWVFHGTPGGSDWWAEKRCQMEGKFTAVASTSAGLITAIQNVENFHAGLGTNSPEFSQGGNYKGHI